MSTRSQLPSLAFLMTGSELMSGDIHDTNSGYLAKQCLDIGLELNEKVTVGDQADVLLAQVQRLTQQHDVLIMNGGLAPTQDDLTADILAQAAGINIAEHPQAKQHVLQWCEQRGFEANSANLKQSLLPEGCNILPEAPGSAAAFYLTINNCLVVATPGVPSELKTICQTQLLDLLQTRFHLNSGSPWQRYHLFGIGESRLQQRLDEQLQGIDDVLDIGFRAGFPVLELKFKAKPDQDEAAITTWQQRLLQNVDDFLLDGQSIPHALVTALQQQQSSFSCAESCTGGLIASEITKIPGASAVFPGGIVSYSNALKQQLLQVPEHILEQQGAVSQGTVEAMLNGLLTTTGAEYGVAVSGIAGPGGGSEEKPVGTVWIAWGSQTQQDSVCLNIKFERLMFQQMVAAIGMDLVRRQLLGKTEKPAYLSRWL